jgi:rare lipoprotein A
MLETALRRMPPPALLALALLAPLPTQAFDPQVGGAAIYDAKRFTGRPMANGRPFQPGEAVAAHRHLPLGTVAEVTNLRTGATTRVVISDRGPFTPGRIIDLSPRSAREIGIRDIGQVEIRPVSRPAN